MKTTERLLRYALLAPVVDMSTSSIDEDLPPNCIAVSGTNQVRLGVSPGDQVIIKAGNKSRTVLVLDGDNAVPKNIYDEMGPYLNIRRKLGPLVIKELLLLSITIVGMAIVVLTLSGDMQKIAAILSGLGLIGHFFSLRMFRSRR
jgi:hypothetical protein